MLRHMRQVHRVEGAHICEKCPVTFARKQNLQKHLENGNHWQYVYCIKSKEVLTFATKGERNAHFRGNITPSYFQDHVQLHNLHWLTKEAVDTVNIESPVRTETFPSDYSSQTGRTSFSPGFCSSKKDPLDFSPDFNFSRHQQPPEGPHYNWVNAEHNSNKNLHSTTAARYSSPPKMLVMWSLAFSPGELILHPSSQCSQTIL